MALGKSKRGFSFRYNEDLDMCYGKTATVSAKEIINQWPSRDRRIIRNMERSDMPGVLLTRLQSNGNKNPF